MVAGQVVLSWCSLTSTIDDLCLVGNSADVLAALSLLRSRCSEVGLRLSTGTAEDKGTCELILAACGESTLDVSKFPPDFKVVRDGDFELLGGPIGSPAFCNQHTQARVDKA